MISISCREVSARLDTTSVEILDRNRNREFLAFY